MIIARESSEMPDSISCAGKKSDITSGTRKAPLRSVRATNAKTDLQSGQRSLASSNR